MCYRKSAYGSSNEHNYNQQIRAHLTNDVYYFEVIIVNHWLIPKKLETMGTVQDGLLATQYSSR